jgi:hypothetical protein
VNTVSSSAKIAAVPLPWWTSHGHLQSLSTAPVPLGLHQARGHGHVVEHAIARALVGVRVMRAAAQAGADAARRTVGVGTEQRDARRGDGRADRVHGARGQRRRPFESDLALARGAQRAVEHVGDVARVMRQRQLAVAGGAGDAQLDAARVGLDATAQQPVLADRKPMPWWQREDMRVEVESNHGRV